LAAAIASLESAGAAGPPTLVSAASTSGRHGASAGALARVGAPAAPAVSSDVMAAAKDMNEDDRNAMIRGMVDRLATRLKQNGDDVEGWLRLVRAYMVMGERDKAVGALTEARQAVAADAERLRQLNDGLKKLGLDG
jgi:cytochrome c-type biogenesis protein CcmH